MKGNIKVSVAERDDLLNVAGLIYSCYRREGYIPPNAFRVWFYHFQLLPEATVWVAKKEGRVLATLTILRRERGVRLPCEYSFPTLFLNENYCEILALANEGPFEAFLRVCYRAFSSCGKKLLIIETHPRRKHIFSRFGFRVLEEGAIQHVACRAPVLLMEARTEDVLERMLRRFPWLTGQPGDDFSSPALLRAV